MVIWSLTFVVGLGGFAHCIAGSGEVLAAVLTHHAGWLAYPRWFLPAVGGNICGGVLMVTVLEYGQVIYGGDADARNERDASSAKVPAEQVPQFSGMTSQGLQILEVSEKA